MAGRRIHTDGHELPVATVSFLAPPSQLFVKCDRKPVGIELIQGKLLREEPPRHATGRSRIFSLWRMLGTGSRST